MAQLKGKILAGKVLVKPNEAEEKTASGIIIPDSAMPSSDKCKAAPFCRYISFKALARPGRLEM